MEAFPKARARDQLLYAHNETGFGHPGIEEAGLKPAKDS